MIGRGTWPQAAGKLDLVLRAVFGAGFLIVASAVGLRGWPLWTAGAYLVLVTAHAAAAPKLHERGSAAARAVQIVADLLVITSMAHMSGCLTTVVVMLYPIIIFGVTIDWGVAQGRVARIGANYLYAALLAATYFGLLQYDPYVQGSQTHLDYVLSHNVIWRDLPRWGIFLAAGATVLGSNLAAYLFAEHLARERERANRLLVGTASRRAVAEVVTGLAHSLGRPLAEARSLLESAGRDLGELSAEPAALTEDTRSDVEFSASIVGRCQSLVERLDELVRLPADFREVLSINDLVRSARRELARQYGSKAFLVYDHTDPDLPAVRGDLSLLFQAVRGLIEQALLSLPDAGGRVHVATYVQEGQVVLECADNGEGISQARLDALFDPLAAPRAGAAHPGLGLALAREVIRQHQGTLDIESRPGAGTTVRVALPRSA